jgi:hypothetical protein
MEMVTRSLAMWDFPGRMKRFLSSTWNGALFRRPPMRRIPSWSIRGWRAMMLLLQKSGFFSFKHLMSSPYQNFWVSRIMKRSASWVSSILRGDNLAFPLQNLFKHETALTNPFHEENFMNLSTRCSLISVFLTHTKGVFPHLCLGWVTENFQPCPPV